MGNALVELEASFPFNIGIADRDNCSTGAPFSELGGRSTSAFRATNACCNTGTQSATGIQGPPLHESSGVSSSWRLFDPPIDPGCWSRLPPVELNVNQHRERTDQPIGPIRSQLLIQKALELASEVRASGHRCCPHWRSATANIWRCWSGRERQIQAMQAGCPFLQWKQSEEAITSLLKTRASALDRIKFYQRCSVSRRIVPRCPKRFSKDAERLQRRISTGPIPHWLKSTIARYRA